MYADLYDFDKTIFRGESGSEFLFFCIRNNPKMIKHLPEQAKWSIKYFLDKSTPLEECKEHLYCALKDIDALKMIELFWEKNEHRINSWFKERDKSVPVIVCSASPYWQIAPICKKLGVDVIIGTDIDPKTGKIKGKNCKGKEKLNFIKKYAPEYEIRDAYTDNIKSDAPLLSLATRYKFKVTKGKLEKI